MGAILDIKCLQNFFQVTNIPYLGLISWNEQVYGARPLRRWLERKVVTQLSRMLINDEIDDNSTVYVDVKPGGGELTYRVERNGGLVNAATGVKSDILIEVPNVPHHVEASKSTKRIKMEDLDMDEDAMQEENWTVLPED